MVLDVTLDTNVLEHAENPGNAYQDLCIAYLESLLRDDCETKWCLEYGFSPDESKNRCRLYSEYKGRLDVSSLGMAVLAELAKRDRINSVVPAARSTREKVRRLKIEDGNDRRFLMVAANSESKILVSHDFTDFTDDVRAKSEERLNVSIIEIPAMLELA